MEIGTLLTLSVKNPETNSNTTYRCKIIEKNEHYLFIDYPINEDTKRTSILPKGTIIQTSYIGQNQSVFSFKSKIVAKVNVTIPALAITIPKKEDVKKIQRRAYVRIETTVDVSVQLKETPAVSFATVTTDISGGGMSIIIPANQTLNENDLIDVWLVLHMQNGKFHYINNHSKVVRVITNSDIHKASIKFETISKQDQQLVIQYCFEKQRELRTKELQ